MDDWIELQDTDEEGNPVYPAARMPKSKYNPDNEDVAKKTSLMEEVLISARDTLIFCISVSS